MKRLLSPLAFFSATFIALAARAQDAYEGMAKPWQLGFQDAATPVMQRLSDMHNFLLVVITIITIAVLCLMVYICVRFHHRFNPEPSKTAHNTRLEIIWTVIPILILVVIAIPSLRIHYFMEEDVKPDMTLKVVGYQWYWHYDYPDFGGFGFDSYYKKDKDLKPGDHRLLSVDNAAVVPVDTKVRVLITGADVIHSWSVPAFGVKRDAVPGRLNESWFQATKIGTFYGQCSQLCGVGHGFMPIVVKVVSRDDFNAWVKAQQDAAHIAPAAAAPEKPAAPAPAPAAPPVAKPAAPAPAPKPQAAATPAPKPKAKKPKATASAQPNSSAPITPAAANQLNPTANAPKPVAKPADASSSTPQIGNGDPIRDFFQQIGQ